MELWSGHHQRAERLTAQGLEVHPWHNGLKITRARALWNLEDDDGALEMVEDVLETDPSNETAETLRRALRSARRQWRTGLTYRHDSFSGGRSPWQETRFSVGRQTPVGSVIGRVYRADRFGYTDHMFEIEMYPRFRPGFYAYVSAARSDQSALFPSFRFGTERLQERRGRLRGLPGLPPPAVHPGRGHLRRVAHEVLAELDVHRPRLRDPQRPGDVGLHARHGPEVRRGRDRAMSGSATDVAAYRDEVRTIADILVLGSDTLAGEIVKPVGAFELSLGATLSREGRAGLSDLWQFGVTTDVAYRF